MSVYKRLPLAILFILNSAAFAESADTEPSVVLDVMAVNVSAQPSSLAFTDSQKASDLTISRERLKHRSATLGNALAGESGIHTNPFGGGASAPVVRGQEGVRVKITQNGLGVADMASVSPDHAVAVDTLLANRVEVVRGVSTLMYANASPAGVINVVNDSIPKSMPTGVTGETLFRFNTGSDEKLATAGLSVPLSQKFALRVEGLKRSANPYNVPAIDFGQVLDYLPDSYNRSTVGTLGLSYIGDKGHLGVSFSDRKDVYGLVGHNHKFDGCEGHTINTTKGGQLGRAYLNAYPHLMSDSDLVDALHFHCASDYDLDDGHSHSNVYGHKHDHTQKAPWIDMHAKTVAIDGEIISPTPSLDKIRLQVTHSDYKHQEYDEGKHIDDPAYFGRTKFVQGNTAYWGNKGLSSKLSFYHSPTERLNVVWGFDNQKNKTYALIPNLSEKPSNRKPLVTNTQTTNALFGLSQYTLGNVQLHTALRYEKSKIPVEYNLDEINAQIKGQSSVAKQEFPDLTPYQTHATSYAMGLIWDITPKLRLDSTYSHNERIPTPMELYYHGKHLATNSFLYGNKNLDKEKSDNGELGLTFKGDKWRIKGSIYANHFDNYIHPENLYKNGNLAMRRFTQSKARLKGAELEIGYQFSPNWQASVFGDVVRGRLYGFSPIVGQDIYGEPVVVGYEDPDECGVDRDDEDYEEWCAITKNPYLGKDTINRPDRNAPRMSPDRFGVRVSGEWGNFSPSLEYTRVKAQNRTSQSVAAKYNSECPYHDYGRDRLCPIYINEDATAGYDLLNIGLDYHNHFKSTDYTWSIRANNLLNEKIYIHNSFLPFVPQQGRNVELSLNMKF